MVAEGIHGATGARLLNIVTAIGVGIAVYARPC
jgi:hypothetical protein